MSWTEIDELGPVDYLVVEFPAGKSNFSGEMAGELDQHHRHDDRRRRDHDEHGPHDVHRAKSGNLTGVGLAVSAGRPSGSAASSG